MMSAASAVTLVLTVIWGCGQPAIAAEQAIVITVASWGYGAERVDVGKDVAQYCQGKPSCEFKVDNQSFPDKQDPSPGNDKGLIMAWTCGNPAGGATHKYQFAEGKTAKLDCN